MINLKLIIILFCVQPAAKMVHPETPFFCFSSCDFSQKCPQIFLFLYFTI